MRGGEGEWGAKEEGQENKTYARGPVEFRGHEDFLFYFCFEGGGRGVNVLLYVVCMFVFNKKKCYCYFALERINME